MNSLQKDLVIGTLLGDGNLQTNNGQTWRYRALHSIDQQPYLVHKYEVLKEFCQTEPSVTSIFDKRTQKTYTRCSFNTLSSDSFRYFGQSFYEKKVSDSKYSKIVPKNIRRLLNARSLAYWYMDDGSLKWKGKSNAYRLCTDNFQYYEVIRLKEALETKFELKVSIQKQRDTYRIYIPEESSEKFRNLIEPYVIPSMYYKLKAQEEQNLAEFINKNAMSNNHSVE